MSTLRIPVTSADHIQGLETAPIVLVEYGDYECPHCGHAHPIVKKVQKHLGGRLAFIFRNFPLNQAHPNAEDAAETAEFAGAHNKFWQMHDAIFENQKNLSGPFLLELAAEIGLSGEDLADALEKGQYTPRVRDDFTGGVRSGVNGTPTFFINGRRHDGSFEYADLLAALEGAS